MSLVMPLPGENMEEKEKREHFNKTDGGLNSKGFRREVLNRKRGESPEGLEGVTLAWMFSREEDTG